MKGVILLAGLGCLAACNGAKPGASSLPPVAMLSPDSANHGYARFSPDGTRLFWWEPAGQGFQLWTADAKLGNPTKVPVTALQVAAMLWSPDRSQIALSSGSSGYGQVALIPAGGGEPKALTHVTFAVPLAWNRDGDRFIYGALAGGTIRSMLTSVTHGGATNVIPSESRPLIGMYSPDGAHIGYMVIDGSHSTIWVADSVGGHPKQLTTDGFETFGNQETNFSPDGKWILYESRRTGTSDLWVVSVDGGEPRQLTHDVRNDTYGLWSPDGKWIAFLSDRGKQTDVWAVPSAGGEEIRITDDPAVEELMQWRDATHLSFLTGQGTSAIWAISVADSSERRLTPDSLRSVQPSLSPDGTQLVFGVDHGGGVVDIAVMSVAGGAMRTLVQGGNNTELSWSPDGTKIAFTSDRSGTSDVWMVNVAGGEPRQLENWPGLERGAAWSGDGSAIYFVSDRDSRLTDIWQVAATGGEPTRVTTEGSLNNVVTRRGGKEVISTVIDANGNLAMVAINGDGKIVPLPHNAGALPISFVGKSDSVLVAEVGKGGGLHFRIRALDGRGEGQSPFNPGENLGGASEDGSYLVASIANGGTHDLALIDRRTGATRRLTNNSAEEGLASVTPDGKTVIFLRSRAVRRIATADLTKLLAGATKP